MLVAACAFAVWFSQDTGPGVGMSDSRLSPLFVCFFFQSFEASIILAASSVYSYPFRGIPFFPRRLLPAASIVFRGGKMAIVPGGM